MLFLGRIKILHQFLWLALSVWASLTSSCVEFSISRPDVVNGENTRENNGSDVTFKASVQILGVAMETNSLIQFANWKMAMAQSK